MIEKITLASNSNISTYKSHNVTPIRPQATICQKNDFVRPTSENFQSYVVSFGAKKHKVKEDERLQDIKESMTPQAESFYKETQAVAQKYHNQEMTPLHFQYVGLKKMSEYIEKLNSGEVNLDNNDDYKNIAAHYQTPLTEEVFKSKELRNRILPVINEEILNLESAFSELPKAKNNKKPPMSKSFLNDVYNLYGFDIKSEDGDGKFSEGYFVDASLGTSDNKIVKQYIKPFVFKMQESIMLGDQSKQKGAHISLYDEKAKNVLKNIGVGTNMFVTYEDGSNPIYMVTSLEKMLQSGEEFGKISSSNTDIVYVNKYAKFQYLNDKINELAKDKTKTHIVVFDLDKTDDNDSNMRSESLDDKLSEYAPDNVKYVVLAKRDTYLKESEREGGCFKDYQSVSMPMLNIEQTKKAFKEEPLLMADIKKEFAPKAINRVIDYTVQLDGKYPEKAVKIMKQISAFYVDKQEISAKDVENYVKAAKDVFKDTDNNSSIIMKFDTGKKLSDIVGANSMKQDLKEHIKKIRNRSAGSKGIIIYSQDGQIGSGRKFFAEVLAGETKSPYFEVNANDFATDDVAIFDFSQDKSSSSGSDKSISPEKAMQMLFEKIRAQAETSAHKSAVLYIKNFNAFTEEDNNEYSKIAMAQLEREIKKARDDDFNIIAIGAVNSVEDVEQSPEEFIEIIQLESVKKNENARKEIINHFIHKNHIKLNVQSDDEREELISDLAETSDGFGRKDLNILLRKTQNIMSERGHKFLEQDDFIEAYLQLITGARASSVPCSAHRKKIVTSHECGHALTLTVMYNLAKKQGIPWHIPSKVNFLTLDPRGDFGGAMFPKDTENEEMSFEKVFADLVCDYGGNSSEKMLYNQAGSWGITADLKSGTQYAFLASGFMGQGKYYGRKSLQGALFISDDTKKIVERDVDVFTKNASLVSDMIVKNYKGFVEEFTDKYACKVGTGDCLVTSEEFGNELNDWLKRQTPEKRNQLEKLDNQILNIIEASKNGKIARKKA